MKTVSTKLDKQTFEKFQKICDNDGLCISEKLRDSIKMEIEAYEDELEIEKGQKESISNPSKPVPKVVKISYDGITWYDID